MKKKRVFSILLAMVLCITMVAGSTANSYAASYKTYSKQVTKTSWAHNPVVMNVKVKENTKGSVVSKSVTVLNCEERKNTLTVTIPKKGYVRIKGSVFIEGKGVTYGSGNEHVGISCVGIDKTVKYK